MSVGKKLDIVVVELVVADIPMACVAMGSWAVIGIDKEMEIVFVMAVVELVVAVFVDNLMELVELVLAVLLVLLALVAPAVDK